MTVARLHSARRVVLATRRVKYAAAVGREYAAAVGREYAAAVGREGLDCPAVLTAARRSGTTTASGWATSTTASISPQSQAPCGRARVRACLLACLRACVRACVQACARISDVRGVMENGARDFCGAKLGKASQYDSEMWRVSAQETPEGGDYLFDMTPLVLRLP